MPKNCTILSRLVTSDPPLSQKPAIPPYAQNATALLGLVVVDLVVPATPLH
jgi:hypothetical protein